MKKLIMFCIVCAWSVGLFFIVSNLSETKDSERLYYFRLGEDNGRNKGYNEAIDTVLSVLTETEKNGDTTYMQFEFDTCDVYRFYNKPVIEK